ncbi:MAG: Ig domain-containing protein [Candidatus Competibacter phosphatis]
MNTALPFRAALLALAVLICLPFAGINAAQSATLTHNAWGTNYSVVCTGYDALQFNATRNPGEGGPPFAGNTLLMLSDVTYWYPNYPCYESTTWTSNGTGRKAAKVSGAYMNPNPTSPDDFYLPIDRFIKLRNLTIDDVDLDYDNMALWFALPDLTPQNIALTLNNGSLTGLNPPSFNVLAPFTLTAAGDSTLSNWGKGPVSSQTTLNVTPGSKLTFFRLGNYAHGTFATDSWYFSHPGNVAMIDAGTLHLDQSFVTFGQSVFVPGEVLGKLTFQNNALLDITGEGGRLYSGSFNFLNSRLNLGSANRLKAVDRVTINGANVTTDEDSQLVTAALDVFGTNTFALGNESSAGNYIATTGAMVMEPGASLTLNGQGSLAVTFGLDYAFPASGQIVINDRATLVNTGALFNIRPSSPITINRTSAAVSGVLMATNGGSLVLNASAADPGQVTNHGYIIVGTDSTLQALGPVIIQGGSEGLLDIGDAGTLMIGNPGTALAATESLTTNNLVELDNFSALQLTLDPTARKNGQLRAGSTLGINWLAELHLALVNDAVLPDGTKFTLIDYGAFASSQHFFNGHPNGSTFVLGLNHYRINYADTPDPGYNGAITLTVVAPLPPVSLSPAVQTVAGTVGAPLTQTAAMIPSGFGGTVTYTISPGLPNGLTFNNATGAIFGTPTAALTSTAFTIRAAGSVSGTATATVNLTIGVASQTITFGPAPTPTFAAGGGFQVFASATSGLPVTYSSLTPAICDAHGSTILMLGAGTCTIAANQPGNSSYSPAPQATQTITIAKATPKPLTLSAVPPKINVGETSALSISGGSGTGAISYTATGSGTCTISGNTLTGTAVGTCTITATQAADAN